MKKENPNLKVNEVDSGLIPSTRMHKLPLSCRPETQVFLKREDETGMSVSGNKRRKIAGILPFLRKNGFREIHLIGSGMSNMVIAAAQLLKEAEIPVSFWLKENKHSSASGNAFLRELLIPESQIRWIPSGEWDSVESRVSEFCAQKPDCFWLPEGGNCPAALSGTLSLARDVRKNESDSGLELHHIYIDAGTGLTAMGLCLGLAAMGGPFPTVHIVLMAEGEAEFLNRWQLAQAWFRETNGWLPEIFPEMKLSFPVSARSFGAVNASVRKTIQKWAREYGVLLDPVYNAKLAGRLEADLESGEVQGNILMIHSGGSQTLFGFAERLLKP